MRNRSTVTGSTLLILYKWVKEGHRLEKLEHCDREYTIIIALSVLLFLRESDRSFGNVVFVSPFFRGGCRFMYTQG